MTPAVDVLDLIDADSDDPLGAQVDCDLLREALDPDPLMVGYSHGGRSLHLSLR